MLRIVAARAGSVRIGEAHRFVEGLTPGTEGLVLASSRGAADDFVRSLRATTFGLHRMSLAQFAFRMAAGRVAERGLTPVSPLGAQASAAHVGYRLAANGELAHLGAVADFPGFAPSLARSLQELRLASVNEAAGEIGALLDAYNAELEENRFSDAAVLFEIAAEAVRASPPSMPVVLLDVRTESRAEREFVRAVIDTAPAVLATVHSADAAMRGFFESVEGGEAIEGDDGGARRVEVTICDLKSDVRTGERNVGQADLPWPEATLYDWPMSDFIVEVEREEDGRWISEVTELPGVLAYGTTRDEALAKAKALAFRVLADRIEHGEDIPQIDGVFAVHE